MSSRWSASSAVSGGTWARFTAASTPASMSARISLRVRLRSEPSPSRVGIRSSVVICHRLLSHCWVGRFSRA